MFSNVEQDEEIEVLTAIYPDFITMVDEKENTLRLEIPVELDNLNVEIVQQDDACLSNDRTAYIQLSSLPPVLLDVYLPPDYPHGSPPLIRSLNAVHLWLPLSVLLRMRDAFAEMWEDGPVLTTWVDAVVSGDIFMQCDVVQKRNHGKVLRLTHQAPHLLLPLLVQHDSRAKSDTFSRTAFCCPICERSRKGAEFVMINRCGHVFCRDCLHQFWHFHITEGDVTKVNCPDQACMKLGEGVGESDLLPAVSESDVRRWAWLTRKRLLESDPNVVHCPIKACQTPVPPPPEPESAERRSDGWRRLRTCSECGYSFCVVCLRTWHGPISDCAKSTTSALLTQYMEQAEGSPERELMEKRYGKTMLQDLLKRYEEDNANRHWLDQSTMPCPGCNVRVEKSMGCNHMTCVKCKQHFCYRCGARIRADNPYLHFSTRGNPCFSKLFDHVPGSEWQPVEGFYF